MKFPRRFQAACAALVVAALTACASDAKHESTGQYVDDTTITTKVKTAFAEDPQVKVTQVKVETYKGIVQLSGFVDSRASAERAVQLARKVKGVQAVKDNMQVK